MGCEDAAPNFTGVEAESPGAQACEKAVAAATADVEVQAQADTNMDDIVDAYMKEWDWDSIPLRISRRESSSWGRGWRRRD
jgi:hypothetical protein